MLLYSWRLVLVLSPFQPALGTSSVISSLCDRHSRCCHSIAMVKGIKRKAEDSIKKSGTKALRRVAGPTTSQIREAKQSMRSLAAAVEMLQETEDMKDERELIKRIRMMTIDGRLSNQTIHSQ